MADNFYRHPRRPISGRHGADLGSPWKHPRRVHGFVARIGHARSLDHGRRPADRPSVSGRAHRGYLRTALALRFAGSRTARRELIWVSYAAIALGVVKPIFEDFRQSHPAALAVSLLCYGAFLILAPRLSGKIVSERPLKPLEQRRVKAGGSQH